MPNVKTTTLTGTETKVTLPQNYPYCFITNMSEAEIYASGNPGVVPYADGVYTIPAGTEIRISPEASGDTLWLLGSGKVQIRGEEIAAPTSFKRSVKGGEISFSGDYNDLTNKPDIPVPSEVIDSNSTNKTVSTSKSVFDYVISMLASAGFKPVKVTELPKVGSDRVLYLLPKDNLLSGNFYDEYLWIDNTYELVGTTDVDLSNYATINNLTSHTDNKNNPHGVKPLQIKKDDLVLHRGKTVAEFKSELLNWWNSACGTLSVYRFSGGTVPWWLENFKNDEEIIPAGATYTIISIADYAPDKRHATFLFSAASNSNSSNEILKLELFNGQFVYLSKLVDLSDYATIEQLNGKQDIITNIGLIFDGLFLKNKTVGEAKEIIINTYLSNSNKFGVFMRVPNDIIYNWNTDDYVLKAGSLCQITPIGNPVNATGNKLYGRFLISDYEYSSQDPSRIYTFVAAVCTMFGFIFGDLNGLMIALVALIVLDYISGVIAAAVEKKLSSEVGAKGIAKKIFMLLIVAVANIVDINVIGERHVLKSVTIVFYIANECISLIENAGRLGVPVPKKLIDVLEQLKNKEK